jgi:hypothetical protein
MQQRTLASKMDCNQRIKIQEEMWLHFQHVSTGTIKFELAPAGQPKYSASVECIHATTFPQLCAVLMHRKSPLNSCSQFDAGVGARACSRGVPEIPSIARSSKYAPADFNDLALLQCRSCNVRQTCHVHC